MKRPIIASILICLIFAAIVFYAGSHINFRGERKPSSYSDLNEHENELAISPSPSITTLPESFDEDLLEATASTQSSGENLDTGKDF